MAPTQKSLALRGSFSVFFSAAVWGVFWLPMRYFHDQGLETMWGVAAINFAAALIAIPAVLFVRDFKREHLKWLLIIGAGMGFANVFYFAGLILSDVIRVTFLFYLLPIWATLFSKLFFNVKLGIARIIAIGFAFVGIWLLLGGGDWPIPQNIGDVFGILSGMAWAFGLTMIRGQNELGAFSTTASGHIFALIAALGMGVIFSFVSPDVQGAFPASEEIADVFPFVLVFGIIVLWTTMLGQVWGAKYIAATTAALLTMSEIVVATGSATLIGGETLTVLSWLGGGLIIVAIFIDLFGGSDD